jgi:rubredoxin
MGKTPPQHLLNPYPSPPKMEKISCIVCNFVYHETTTQAPNYATTATPWAELPPSWTCPQCGVYKADFEIVQHETQRSSTLPLS